MVSALRGFRCAFISDEKVMNKSYVLSYFEWTEIRPDPRRDLVDRSYVIIIYTLQMRMLTNALLLKHMVGLRRLLERDVSER